MAEIFEREAGRPMSRAAALCGDWLVTFGDRGTLPSPRFPNLGPWRDAGGVWLAPGGAGWRGFPLRTFQSGPWTFWLLGDLALPAGDDPGTFLRDLAGDDRLSKRLNGHFLLLGRCETDGRWYAWTDRFGTVHAYFARSGSRAALGTSFASVASATSRRSLDWPALSAFFAFGFFPADRTFFEDVRILRPATRHVFTAEGELLSAERYWDWSHRPDRSRSFDDTVAEFAQTLHGVLDDQTRSGRIAVPISGGLDSRTTFAALTRTGSSARERLWCYSYGYGEDSIETRIGRRVAEARGVPIETLAVEPYLFDRLGSVLGCVEGFQDVTQARQAVIADRLAERSDAVIAAHWGDVWLGDMGLAGTDSADSAFVSAHAYKKIAKRGRRWLLDELARPHLSGHDPDRIVRDFVDRELDRVAAIAEPDFRVKAFKTDQWSFRWTLASLRMYQAGAWPLLPFYDTRMSDFIATVPTEFVSGRRLQIEYLKRYAPDLARVTWQESGASLYRSRRSRTWLLPWRVARKAARLVMRTPNAPERNWEVQFSGSGAERLRGVLLGPNARLHELVEPARIEHLLEAFFRAPLEEGRGYTVSMLLTFAAFLKTLEAHAR